MKKTRGLIIASILLTVCIAQELKVRTFPIPLMVVNKTEGVFVELTKEIFSRANLDMDLSISSPMKMMSDFAKGNIDVTFPALDVNFVNMAQPLKSAEIYTKRDFIFTTKGNGMLSDIADLEGKKIGITKGYPYAAKLMNNKKIKLVYADTDAINARKLIAGRIDAFVVEEKSGLAAFKSLELTTEMQYNPKKPFSLQQVYYAIRKGANSKENILKISKAINAIKADGTFGKIMSKAN